MWLRLFGEEGTERGRCCFKSDGVGGESLAALANSNNHKITFLLSLSSTKTQVFFSSFAPSSFFFLLSAAHNSEHYDGCPEALEWIQCRIGLHPPPQCTLCRMLHWSQTLWLWLRRRCLLPLPCSRQEAEWFRVFPSLFSPSILTSFFQFLSFSLLQKFPCGAMATFFENFTSVIRDGQFEVRPVEQLAHF